MNIPDKLVMHNGETLPVYPASIFVPHGSTLELTGEADVGNLINAGTVRVRNGAVVTFSNILNLPGASFLAGTPEEPISCEFRHRPVPYQADDPTKRGNSFISVNARTELYGRHEHHGIVLRPNDETPPTWHPSDHVEEHEGWRVNFARSIRFTRVDDSHPIRPHFMLMHQTSEPAVFKGAEWAGWGVSDKSTPLHETDNPRAAYPFHPHRCGEDNEILVEDCSVHTSNGIGFANHSSNVTFRRCVSSAFGCSYFMEAGNEIGLIEDCVDINTLSNRDSVSDQTNLANGARGDFGIGGEGIWCQSPRVVIRDHTSINAGVGVFWYLAGLFELADGTLTEDGVPVERAKKFADGSYVHRTPTPDVNRLTIVDPRGHALRSRWAFATRTLRNVNVTGCDERGIRGQHGVGIRVDYDAGFRLEDSSFSGNGSFGIHVHNSPNPDAALELWNVVLSGFVTGLLCDHGAGLPLTIEDSQITAQQTGIRRFATKSWRLQNMSHVNRTSIDASFEVELMPPLDDHPDYERTVNEFWRDGVKLAWPGLEGE